jgi:hypothetical protein
MLTADGPVGRVPKSTLTNSAAAAAGLARSRDLGGALFGWGFGFGLGPVGTCVNGGAHWVVGDVCVDVEGDAVPGGGGVDACCASANSSGLTRTLRLCIFVKVGNRDKILRYCRGSEFHRHAAKKSPNLSACHRVNGLT